MQRIISAFASDAETASIFSTGADHGRRPAPGNLLQHFQRNHHVMLPISAERAARRIEQKAFGLVHRVRGELFVFEPRRPAGHGRGDGFFAGGLLCGQEYLLDESCQLSAVSGQ